MIDCKNIERPCLDWADCCIRELKRKNVEHANEYDTMGHYIQEYWRNKTNIKTMETTVNFECYHWTIPEEFKMRAKDIARLYTMAQYYTMDSKVDVLMDVVAKNGVSPSECTIFLPWWIKDSMDGFGSSYRGMTPVFHSSNTIAIKCAKKYFYVEEKTSGVYADIIGMGRTKMDLTQITSDKDVGSYEWHADISKQLLKLAESCGDEEKSHLNDLAEIHMAIGKQFKKDKKE